MKKYFTSQSFKEHVVRRSNYEMKRRRPQYKKKKAFKKQLLRLNKDIIYKHQGVKEYYKEIIEAPHEFSFIENTENILRYLNKAHKKLKNDIGVFFDLQNIKSVTSDSVAVLLAHIDDKEFTGTSTVEGNYPKDKSLQKYFVNSGLHNFVKTSVNGDTGLNVLHKESHIKVKPELAHHACLNLLNHCNVSFDDLEPIYNIIIECMQNTNNHASLNLECKYRWWLLSFFDDDDCSTSYTFLDLGVGIFDSLVVKDFINRNLHKFGIVSNEKLASLLLKGQIQSRIEKDNNIRGKGIKQILKYSKLELFESFFLVSNNIHINLKSEHITLLSENFSGTLYYWKIKKIS
ncbi:MAG: hypothetical protein R2774_05400 [Saprospiraceae bacterium]